MIAVKEIIVNREWGIVNRKSNNLKSSSKSHGFFIKRVCSFLVEDKLFNQKKYYLRKFYYV